MRTAVTDNCYQLWWAMRTLQAVSSDRMAYGTARDGVVLQLAASDNLLSGDRPEFDAWRQAEGAPPACMAWSGSLGAGLFEKDPMTWLAPGHSAFSMFCDAIEPMLVEAGRRLIIRPHCRHVICDATAAAGFFAERPNGPIRFALDPSSMFEQDMLWRVDDHLARAFELLGPLCDFLVLASPGQQTDSHGLPLRLPVGEGKFSVPALIDLIGQHCRADVSIFFPVGDEREQAALLGL